MANPDEGSLACVRLTVGRLSVCLSVPLTAGLEGIEQELTLPPPNKTNLFSATDGMSAKQMAAEGVGRLPQNLAEAVSVRSFP
eukprot:SAG22_NODE_3079_length_1957_cov_2.247578_3_plen_83_part_00